MNRNDKSYTVSLRGSKNPIGIPLQGGEQCPQASGIHHEGCRINIAEENLGTGAMNAPSGGKERVGSGDNRITHSYSHGHQECQLSISSRGHSDHMTTAEICAQITLKRLHFSTKDITSMSEDAKSSLADSLIDLCSETAQVKKWDGKRKRHLARKSVKPASYFTTPNSARRFLAQAKSLLAESTGISEPKLTV